MKFYGMSRALKTSLESKLNGQMQADELLAHLIEQEWLDREERKTQRHITSAVSAIRRQFPEMAYGSIFG
jgi:hypothetical protein